MKRRVAPLAAGLVRRTGPSIGEDFPKSGPRSTARRRALIVAAVNRGRLSLDEARRRFRMSLEEFSAWDRALRNCGLLRRGAGRAAAHPIGRAR